MAWVDPHDDNSGLGPLHPGFFFGMPALMDAVIPTLRPRVVVGGHSLGGARALQAAGLIALDGRRKLAGVVTIGSPKPGFAKLTSVLAPYPVRSYRNGDEHAHAHDYVTNAPFTFPPEEYEHPRALIDVYSVPPPSDPWGIFRFHHASLYDAALAGIKAATE